MGSSTKGSRTNTMELLLPLSLLCVLPPVQLLYVTPQGEQLAPQPFSYQYSVQDQKYNNVFSKTESQAPDGTVSGSFRILLPDGRVQTTTYHADHYEGFTASVEYEGSPTYPQPSHSDRQVLSYTPSKDRPVLSYTPSPYVAPQPYRSSVVFSDNKEDGGEQAEEQEERRRRRYRIY